MKIGYDVGDVVVCINARQNPNFPPHPLNHGGSYRVIKIDGNAAYNALVNDVGPSVWLAGIAENEDGFGWFRFRKIPKADDDFTEFMRKMKPTQTEKPRCPLTGEPLTVGERFKQECG